MRKIGDRVFTINYKGIWVEEMEIVEAHILKSSTDFILKSASGATYQRSEKEIFDSVADTLASIWIVMWEDKEGGHRFRS